MFCRFRYRIFDALSKKQALPKLDILNQLQWRSHDELLAIQNEKLRKVVRHAYDSTVYYRELFDSLGIAPDDIRSKADLATLPVLTKRVIKKNYDQFKVVNFDSYSPRIRATSGSTGDAFQYVIDRETHSWVHGYLLLSWQTAGFQFGDRVITVAAGNIKHSFLKRSVLSFLKNSVDIPSFNFDEDEMDRCLAVINRVKPGIIYGYSSALALLSKYALEKNRPVFSPKGIVTTAENLLPHNRDRIEKAFRCKVFDQYGVMECGITAFECEKHNGFHLGMTKGVVETVDDSGVPVTGIPGRIICTDLDNYAFPILRYDSGDMGVYTGRLCSCGRGFELLDSVEGRTREFLTSRSGKKVHGAVFSYLVRDNPWINQYQVVQKVAGQIEVRIVADTPVDIERRKEVDRFVNAQCGNDMDVQVVQVADIPLSANNKRHFVVSEITNI